MNVLNKLASKNIKLNKKRTIGTIIGIILSVALLCAVAGLGTSLKATLVENAIDETGYYHLELIDINKEKVSQIKNNRDVLSVRETYHIGTSYYDYEKDKDNLYFDVHSMNKDDFDYLSYKLIEGSYPINNNEIVVTKKTLVNASKKIGDTINLNIGYKNIVTGEDIINATSKSYKIVGVISGNSSYYYGITTNETSKYINAYISLKKPKAYKKTITQILGLKKYSEVEYHDIEALGFDYNLNRELLRWESFAFSDSTVTTLYALIGIVMFIIVGTSIFCIRNSFAISSEEKRKMYGMLSSVGATKKQLKEAVLKEGFILGLVGIPLGVLFGILAVYILIYLCNLILGESLFATGIVFKISILPIILSCFLGIITIYFSALGSAKKTSKISPIEVLRNNNDIKITSKKLKTPKTVKKLFKTGGVIAYKNLKRSKKKYRTTVISLTISIFAFISMSSFISEAFKNTSNYLELYDYNISLSRISDLKEEDIDKLNNIVDIKNKYTVYEYRGAAKIDNPKFDKTYEKDIVEVEGKKISLDNKEPVYISILALDNETFKSYMKKVGKSYESLKDKGIIFDSYRKIDSNNTTHEYNIYEYKKDDEMQVTINSRHIQIPIGEKNLEKPYGLESVSYADGFIIVNKDYYNYIDFSPKDISIDSANAEDTVNEIEKIYEGKDVLILNMEDRMKEDRAMLLIVSIFLYGFIAVITLIGVTNIFNTITSNIELRAKEFACLKSIGMTKKEFNHMINLETIFYSVKSLFYGIVLGILGSAFVHRAFDIKFESNFIVPFKPIIISIFAVFILVWIIMKYGMKRVNKQNIIETIRNDNV